MYMSVQLAVKPRTQTKVSFTFGDNPELVAIISELELIYRGMSRSEIVKLAIIELLNLSHQRNLMTNSGNRMATEIEKSNIKESINSGFNKTLTERKDISNYLKSLAAAQV
jgi:hypothetical protein